MDQKHFQRLAPRFLDGESPALEEERIQQTLMSDPAAQADVELLETEAKWISRAIAQDAESDISRVIIRVRRRNPYRKKYVSPVLSLSAQLVLVGVVILVMFWLANSLTPVRALAQEVTGNLSLQDADPIQVGDVLSGGDSVFLEGETDQGRLLLDASDLIRLNGVTILQILPPQERARKRVQLELGEAWIRSLSRTEAMELHLAGDKARGGFLQLLSAEVSIQVDGKAIDQFIPRGASRMVGDIALVRVLEGEVTWSLKAEKRYDRGSTFMIRQNGEIREIGDPDREHYVALRLDGEGKFRRGWNAISTERFPFSREVVPFAQWRVVAAACDDLERRMKEIRHRDGVAEITKFRADINTAITGLEVAQPRNNTGEEGTPEKEKPLFSTLEHPFDADIKLVAAAAESLAVSDPGFLIMLRPHIRRLLEQWENSQPSLLHLYTAPDMTQVWKVLSNMAGSLSPRIERASQLRDNANSARERFQEAVENSQKAIEDLDLVQKSEYLDEDGARRKAISDEVAELRKELERLRSVESSISLKRVSLGPIEANFERAQKALAKATADLRNAGEALSATLKALEDLKFEVDEVLSADAVLKSAMTELENRKGDEEDLLRDSGELKADLALKKRALDSALLTLESVQSELQVREEALAESESLLAQRTKEVNSAREQRDFAEGLLLMLPEGDRAGSVEEAGLQDALALLEATTEAARDAESAVGLNSGLVEKSRQAETNAQSALQSAKETHAVSEQLHVQCLEAVKVAQQARVQAERALANAEAAQILALKRQESFTELNAQKAIQEPAKELAVSNEDSARKAFADAEAQLLPLRAEFEALQKEAAKIPDLEGRIGGLNADYRRIDGAERELIFAQKDAFIAAEKAASAQHEVFQRLLTLDRLISGEPFVEEGDLEGSRTAVSFALADIAQAYSDWSKEKTAETSGDLRDLLVEGMQACQTYKQAADLVLAELTPRTESEFRRIRAVRLSLTWLAAIASRHSFDAIQQEQARFEAFRGEREKLWGTSIDSPTSLTSQMVSAWKSAQPNPPIAVSEDEMKRLFGSALRSFYWVDPASDQEGVGSSYLGLLRAGIRDDRLRRPAIAWLESLKVVLGQERLGKLSSIEQAGR